MWLIEGLFVYLSPEDSDRLIETVTRLSTHGSRLALEYFESTPRQDDVATVDETESAVIGRIVNFFQDGPALPPPHGWRRTAGSRTSQQSPTRSPRTAGTYRRCSSRAARTRSLSGWRRACCADQGRTWCEQLGNRWLGGRARQGCARGARRQSPARGDRATGLGDEEASCAADAQRGLIKRRPSANELALSDNVLHPSPANMSPYSKTVDARLRSVHRKSGCPRN